MQHEDRLFLMDGDALIIPQKRLLWILERIEEHLPRVKRVGAYANVKSVKKKSPEELKQLREHNLGILYYGVETGDDEIREAIRKGSTARTCIEMGRRVKEAGIQLSVTVLLGIGGRGASLRHARATGELLSAMDPDFVGALTVMLDSGDTPVPGLPERRLRITRRTRVAQGTARNDQPHQPDQGLLLLESRLQLPASQGKASERQAKGPGFDRCGLAGRGASQAGVDAGFVGSAQRAIASIAAARP